ncbi:FCD domain-containing protein [Marinobacter daepoensis]|uniref:FadR family transcriptional regulator n=1 Tax=Marinobacter daepoensis TaxID=262077 RepID=A0ABS3BB69_9GAMM|nr:FCD domain-containing protein [Marinobacter daepoensis]MBN7769110.1 FadR family transcriptional regulator [Marinobacter daepoensis]MBY6032277.1 FCD domain-containing protein [Marinobacter daepoensis]MBY6077800.1 FCD domain-containing protein [Marinobacter daepoensis]
MLTPIRKGSLVETAIESLRQTIENGDWQVGARLPVEADLSDALGVSRNTIREAVRVLVHVGMLETRQGDGTYVRASRDAGETLRRIARSRLAEQIEVRIMLETEAARLAARRRSDADLKAMTSALDDRAASGDQVLERIRHDERFHHALVRASHNAALIELYDYFSNAVSQTIERTEMDSDLPEPSQEDHELLLAAVRRGDSEKAESLSRSLLTPSLNVLAGEH